MESQLVQLLSYGEAFFDRPDCIELLNQLCDGLANSQDSVASETPPPRLVEDILQLFLSYVMNMKISRDDFSVEGGNDFPLLPIVVLQSVDLLCELSVAQLFITRRWLAPMLLFLANNHAIRHHELLRTCASVIVNVTKGCEEARHALAADLTHIVQCLVESSDVHLQLQCIEVIFRVYKTASDKVSQFLRSDPIRPYLSMQHVMQIERIPLHSQRMLPTMMDILHSLNESKIAAGDSCTSSMCMIPCQRIRCSVETEECTRSETEHKKENGSHQESNTTNSILRAGSTVYFGRRVVVLDWKEPDLTIPYASIRSIKLSRTKELVFKLHTLPLSMRQSFPEPNLGDDVATPPQRLTNESTTLYNATRWTWVVALSITEDAFQRMKQQNVQSWISHEMGMHKKRHRGSIPVRTTFGHGPLPDDEDHNSQVSNDPLISRKRPHATRSPSPTTRATPSISTSGWFALPKEQPSNREPSGLTMGAVTTPVVPHRQLQQSTRWFDTSYEAGTREGVTAATAATTTTAVTEIEPMLQELRSVVMAKVQQRQQEGAEIVRQARQDVERAIETLRHRTQTHYSEYRSIVEQEMKQLRAEEDQLKERMAAMIQRLHTDIQELNVQGRNLTDHVVSLQLEHDHHIEELQRKENDSVAATRQKVDVALGAMESKVHSIVMSSNPLRFVTHFLSQPGTKS